jgi:hypothetical protein
MPASNIEKFKLRHYPRGAGAIKSASEILGETGRKGVILLALPSVWAEHFPPNDINRPGSIGSIHLKEFFLVAHPPDQLLRRGLERDQVRLQRIDVQGAGLGNSESDCDWLLSESRDNQENQNDCKQD